MRFNKQIRHHPLFKIYTWFDPCGITNILFLAIVTKSYPTAFYTMENFFKIHVQDRDIVFSQSEGRLYYFDTAAEEDFDGVILTSVLDCTLDKTCLLITLEENLY